MREIMNEITVNKATKRSAATSSAIVNAELRVSGAGDETSRTSEKSVQSKPIPTSTLRKIDIVSRAALFLSGACLIVILIHALSGHSAKAMIMAMIGTSIAANGVAIGYMVWAIRPNENRRRFVKDGEHFFV